MDLSTIAHSLAVVSDRLYGGNDPHAYGMTVQDPDTNARIHFTDLIPSEVSVMRDSIRAHFFIPTLSGRTPTLAVTLTPLGANADLFDGQGNVTTDLTVIDFWTEVPE